MLDISQAIYFDYNATTPIKPAVIDAMQAAMQLPHNASSIHQFGRMAKQQVEAARRKVAALVNAEGYDVIFTSSGTEANNLALRGLKNYTPVISAIEHPCVLNTACSLGNAHIIPVDTNGVIDLEALARILQAINGKAIVSVMLANNETGVIQPVQEAAAIAHRYGALLHTDAAQTIGKIEVDIAELDADLMMISAHKFGGPQGAAALIVRKGITLAAQLTGGGQERGIRAGTENVPAITGFGVAAELAYENLQLGKEIGQMRTCLEQMVQMIAPEAKVIGLGAARLPNTTCITMPGVKNETQLIHFDLAGIAVSSGSACSAGKVDVSHVLLAMGINEQEAATAIRVSLGIHSKKSEIEGFITAWEALYTRVGKIPSSTPLPEIIGAEEHVYS